MDARLSDGKGTLAGVVRASSRSGRAPLRGRSSGITLIEVILAVTIVGVLATMSISSYSKYRERARNAQAVSDIGTIQTAIANWAVDNQGLPKSLADVSPSLATMKDPWGNPYRYLNHATVASNQQNNGGEGPIGGGGVNGQNGNGGGGGVGDGGATLRKDKNIVPINADYDLYSSGPDGKSVAELTAPDSRDDVVRANNGRFIGVVSDYDP